MNDFKFEDLVVLAFLGALVVLLVTGAAWK